MGLVVYAGPNIAFGVLLGTCAFCVLWSLNYANAQAKQKEEHKHRLLSGRLPGDPND